MKLLITGGCGFLGNNLAAHALAQGIELCLYDNLYRLGSTDNLAWLRCQGRFEFVHGADRHAEELAQALLVEGGLLLVHHAAPAVWPPPRRNALPSIATRCRAGSGRGPLAHSADT